MKETTKYQEYKAKAAKFDKLVDILEEAARIDSIIVDKNRVIVINNTGKEAIVEIMKGSR